MTTIYDIAKKAGVSVATVSKVLNNYPDVSSTTRERVEKITTELGYRPSASARGLTTKRSMSLGIFFTDHVKSSFRHPFFNDLIASFKDVVGAEGYDLLFFADNMLHETMTGFVARARHRDVDGLLMLGVPRNEPKLAPLALSQIPCVSVDLDLIGPRASYLSSNNVKGAEQAVEYLVQKGHRRIAFVGDQLATKPGHDRMAGYQRALQTLQVPFHPNFITSGDFTEQAGYQAALRLLDLEVPPTAIFCAGDMMAIGAMQAVRDRGLCAGQDVSFIGFDDISLARYVSPKLTTIRQNREEMGARAARELLDLINNPEKVPTILTVETELVERESVFTIEGGAATTTDAVK